jgi:hypothetical protein
MSNDLTIQKDRAVDLLAAPDTLDAICAHVANGGSLVGLCQAWGIRYSDAVAWVYQDTKRQGCYETAIRARGEWAMETVLVEIRKLAQADVPEDGKFRYADKLRALELLGKSLSLFTERVEHAGEMTLQQMISASYREPASSS